MEDTKIIDLFWKRDERAIQETDLAYGRKLYVLANRILNSREDAEENVSDTYMQAWETIPPQRPQYLFAFLASVCRHLAFHKLDWRSAAKRNAEIVTLSQEMEACIPDSRLDAQMEGREIKRVMEEFLLSIPAEHRLIFLRRYLCMDTIGEIARRYDISQSKVKTQLHRTRAKLYAHLKKEEIYL